MSSVGDLHLSGLRRSLAPVRWLLRPAARLCAHILRAELDRSQADIRHQLASIDRRLDELAQLAIAQHEAHETTMMLVRQRLRYLALSAMADRVPPELGLTKYELSFSSQNGEDGVIAEIFRRIGTTAKVFVEIGAHVSESNCIFLADVLGWRGVIIEADDDSAADLRRKYAGNSRVSVQQAFVNRDNIETVLDEAGVGPDIDLFSIDIDGNDYWVWERMTTFKPRVIVVEYNAYLDWNGSLAQPYDPRRSWDGTAYFGASATALTELGRAKGYRHVHTDIGSCNLFFVREDVLTPDLAAIVPVPRPANYYLEGRRHQEPPPDAVWEDTGAIRGHSGSPGLS